MSFHSTVTRGMMLIAIASSSACAKAEKVTPNNLKAAIMSARPGSRLVLGSNHYPQIVISKRNFTPGITIDATGATVAGIVVRNASGITITGGTVATDATEQFGVLIDFSRDITLTDMHVTGARIGISISRSQAVQVIHNDFGGVRSDGVNVAGSQHIVVDGNSCHDNRSILPVYDHSGKLVTDGDHPDCVQGWSIVGLPPTADVTIINNRGTGYMQGVFFGNPGQGGYDRLVVKNNTFSLSAFNGIVLMEARNSIVSNNVVRTAPGAKMLNYPFKPINTWIHVTGAENQVCGNTVDVRRFSDGGAMSSCPAR